MSLIKKQELGHIPIYQPCGNNCQCSNILERLKNPIMAFYNGPFILNNPHLQNTCDLNKFLQHIQLISERIKSNNQIIEASIEKLEQNQKELVFLNSQIDTLIDQSQPNSNLQDKQILKYMQEKIYFTINSSLMIKVFGRKMYRFKIKSPNDLPKIIYKQRNLHIPLQLTTKQGKLVKNSNLIHLCIAVCDQKGKWIVDQNDQFFIQGKVEVDIYRGECEFKKIYPKDISRHFPGGKLNIVIYAKPSILVQNEPLNKGQYEINYEEIEPLLFSNILIKAKKKHRYRKN